ncbi:MAG TPA: carboxypeptidase regulatory-like domain-containing protein [Longimicrobiales bacterium]|nr:carboxypeptidase regulatory-like domain-containing protein [Longimicrobiales bacterium]
MKLVLALGLLTASLPQQRPDTVGRPPPSIQGVVRAVEDGRRLPVPWALIEVIGPSRRRTVMADSAGRYRVDGIDAGFQRLRASQVGYETVEIEVHVPGGDSVEVDIVLRARAVELPALLVTADLLPAPDTEGGGVSAFPPAQGLVSLRALEASPGLVESGLGDAIRALPGNKPSDPKDVHLMRGSTADLKLVLLDGAPVYAPFHTGGLLPGFDVSSLGAATHHVGGAPARYDGGLSYILDLRTRPARRDAVRSSGSLDLMSLRGGLEAPLGERIGVLATSRALHDTEGWLAGGDRSPYGYVDGLVRADVDLRPGSRLSVTAFGNRESVRLDVPPSATGAGLDEASWGNEAVAAGWLARVGRVDVKVGLAASVYRAELPLRIPEAEAETADDPFLRVASGRTDRTRLTLDLGLPWLGDGVRAGASLDRTGVRYGTRSGDGSSTTRTAGGSVAGAWVDALHHLAPEVDLRYGMRVDRFEPGGTRGALRMAFLWSLGPNAVLTVAGGRYHQLLRLGDAEADLAVGDAIEVGTAPEAGAGPTPLLRVATADHLTLSLDQEVTPTVSLAFEGFLKRFHGLDPGVSRELASSGADLRIVRRGERTTAWLGYSLAWFWDVERAGSDFSGRQLLSAGLQGPLPGPLGVDLRASFSDGLPLTAIPLQETAPTVEDQIQGEGGGAASPTPDRAGGFLRLDAELWAEWTPRWGSRRVHIRPYLRVMNALDRRDALFYYFQPWRGDGLRPLAELPLVPVVGLEWHF